MKNKILLILSAVCFTLIFTSCEEDDEAESVKKIEVTGSAEIEVVPNEIYLNFTVKEYLDASRNKVGIDKVKASFLALCKEAGIPDSNISVAGYAGNERWNYYWYRRRKSEPGFMRSVTYMIKVSAIDKIDKLVSGLNDQAVENFYVVKTSHSNLEQLRREVKTRALLAGKTKAEYLAKSIGEDIGEALLIQEIDNTRQSDFTQELSNVGTYNQATASPESDIAAPPDFQKIKLRYEMRVEFKLD